MGEPSLSLWLAALLVMTFNGLLAYTFRRRYLHNNALLSAVAFFYFGQTVWMVVYLAVSRSAIVPISDYIFCDLNDRPFRVCFAQSIIPTVALLLAYTRNRVFPKKNATVFQVGPENRVIYLLLCAFAPVSLYYYLAKLASRWPQAAGILMYAYLSFIVTPLLIGFVWRTYRVPAVLFVLSTLVAGVFALSEGSRAVIFIPVAFFCLGIWLSQPGRVRIWMAIMAIIFLPLLFQFSAMIESVRRDGIKDASTDLAGRSREVMQLVAAERSGRSGMEVLAQGVGRMVMWSNFVVVSFSPDQVPFRGFSDYWDEVVFLNRSTLFRDTTTFLDEMVDVDYGMGTARMYGFAISAGGTVPVPILADGWSRYGLLGAALFAFVACVALWISEKVVDSVFTNNPRIKIVILCILLGSAFDRMGAYGLTYNLRYLAMQTVLWTTVGYFLHKFLFNRPVHRKTLRTQRYREA